jgi:hypothetical protein
MLTLLAAALLSPQSEWERNFGCWENDMGAACWAGVRALYAAESIEQLQRRGVRVRRLYFLDLQGRISRDGRGHDVQAGMVSIERSAGDVLRLIYYPARRQGLVATPIAARIAAADWDAVMAATEGVQAWTSVGCEIYIHGWEFQVEAADPGGGPIQRRREHSCDEGHALAFADLVTRLAVGALRQCGTAPPQADRWNQIEWLHRCSLQRRTRS